MPRTKRDAHLYELAKIGAQARLSDLRQEARLLVDLFPHLRDSVDADELPINFILKKGRDRAEARKTPGWTAATRGTSLRKLAAVIGHPHVGMGADLAASRRGRSRCRAGRAPRRGRASGGA